jgi:hypothetical protein
MRVYSAVNILITQDDDQRAVLVNMLSQLDDNDSVTAANQDGGYITLAPSAADIAVNFGGVTSASMVFIKAEQEVTVKLDGTGQLAHPVRPIAADADGTVLSSLQKFSQPGIVFWRGKINSIHLGNPSSTASAKVLVVVVGNAT